MVVGLSDSAYQLKTTDFKSRPGPALVMRGALWHSFGRGCLRTACQ
jgi:hypothetical protein